jgi:hypothetical protein
MSHMWVTSRSLSLNTGMVYRPVHFPDTFRDFLARLFQETRGFEMLLAKFRHLQVYINILSSQSYRKENKWSTYKIWELGKLRNFQHFHHWDFHRFSEPLLLRVVMCYSIQDGCKVLKILHPTWISFKGRICWERTLWCDGGFKRESGNA